MEMNHISRIADFAQGKVSMRALHLIALVLFFSRCSGSSRSVGPLERPDSKLPSFTKGKMTSRDQLETTTLVKRDLRSYKHGIKVPV